MGPSRFVLPAMTCLLAWLMTSGCATAPGPALDQVAFAPATGVHLPAMQRTSSGLYYRDLREGQGAAVRTGQRARVYFVGWLPDGTQFDGLAPPAEPVHFDVGAGQVIRAWDEGIVGMRPGGQRQLVVPPALGYGSRQVGPVPRNAVLVFVVELVDVR
jgi:FKBP-type peptidyl-prolyl cis-trans isomerase